MATELFAWREIDWVDCPIRKLASEGNELVSEEDVICAKSYYYALSFGMTRVPFKIMDNWNKNFLAMMDELFSEEESWPANSPEIIALKKLFRIPVPVSNLH